MKIVHSFWSKPMLTSKGTIGKSRWRNKLYLYMSWALSCLTHKDIYGTIELVTDAVGYDLLIKKLRLPYTHVVIKLDELNIYPENFWAIGKLLAYQIQKEPFIHVDGDVYIWNSYGAEIGNAGLISQQIDIDFGHYSHAIKKAMEFGYDLPKILLKEFNNDKAISSSNAGIIGGHDLDFFQEYCQIAFKTIDANLGKIHFNGTSYALLYEQYLFHCLAKQKNKKIQYYLDIKKDGLTKDFGFFNKYSNHKKFVHLLAMRKNEMLHCYDLEDQLKTMYPDYYNIIKNL